VFDCSSPSNPIGTTAIFTDPRDGKSYKTVVMPDSKTWFAQNLNYTKDLTYNTYAYEANGKQFTSSEFGTPAIGSYWCPAVNGSVTSGNETDCRTYGALYTWETAMTVDGKYADETKTSTAWDESWVSPYYYAGAPNSSPNADKNNARGGTNVKGGGRGICPMGWHVPTIKEWAVLLDHVNEDGTGSSFANNDCAAYASQDVFAKLRSPLSYPIDDPGDGSWFPAAAPASGNLNFDAQPAGWRRYALPGPYLPLIMGRGVYSHMWSSSALSASVATAARLNEYSAADSGCWNRAYGFSVRCVAD
jgi:uncharacterized protein (TIGR02145 family)